MVEMKEADLVKLLSVIRSKRGKSIDGTLDAFCDGTPEAVNLTGAHAADLAEIENAVPIYVWEQLEALDQTQEEGDPKDDLEPIRQLISQNRELAPYQSEWQHLKSGHLYVVKMHVIQEATLEPAVIYYRKHGDPRETWCRVASEFFDGRFVRKLSAPQEMAAENPLHDIRV